VSYKQVARLRDVEGQMEKLKEEAAMITQEADKETDR
jgi:hypothetical protein